ncbi:type 2 lanthipeptide synthetase LanM family protein [Hyalangium minutum]|uniref:Lanthionine biosynthesis protein LanM n=1 Tax=Hyalangium minutum TaxID=394096 RepID=A0A085W9K1_9BACT|nr:type 2 lanthipeptide synthetase LanM family protein [Hyalangium minutum]KFE64364.1 Lanthionine biosynthesis protein LanM [Hyalangium minutum]
MSQERLAEEEAVRRIAARASTLWDRLEGAFVPEEGPESAQLASERLAKWRAKAAGGDERLFQKRLEWLGTSPQKVRPLLGDVRLDGPIPAWTRTFQRAMALRRPAGPGGQAAPFPFGELMLPFVEAGKELLAPECRAVFTAEAFDHLLEDLVHELSYVAAPTLLAEFTSFRSRQGGGAEPTSRRLYEAFTAHQLGEGLWQLFSDASVLARLLSTVTEQWARHVSEIARAVKADQRELQRVFTSGAPLGRITSIQPSLSDRHQGGRTVARVTCGGGLQLFYKPRGLGVEDAWYGLLEELNARGGDFRRLRVLDRGDRSWVEPALHAPCANTLEARQFYVRAGMLLSLFYVLEASDCFYENIIAAGAFPVLIDTETLMHHVPHRSQDGAFHSVIHAGFLPSWDVGPRGECFDISGLGATAGQVTGYLRRQWRHVNTDAMALEHVPIQVETDEHLPKLNGVSLRAADYTGELIEGFSMMYRLLRKHREELARPESPLARLGTQDIRFIFHASRFYGLLLKRLCSPQHMKTGVERSIETDILSRFYVESPEKSHYVPLLAAELEALERLDIPCFKARADSHALTLPTGQVLPEAFEQSGSERVWRKLSALDEADLELQMRFIHGSLSMANPPQGAKTGARPRHAAASQETGPLTREELAAEASSIGATLQERALFAPVRMDLYGGLGGIALFYAALEHVSGQGRRMALAALSSLRRFVATEDARRAAQEGYPLGAATGVGSFLYVLCRSATLLGEPSLLEDATRAAGLIAPEVIEADSAFDVMSGVAGAILGLMTLHQATGAAGALEKALHCGEHLLKHQLPCEPAGASWRTRKGRPLTGLAHGAAGIALALLRLHAAVGDARLRQAAEQALAFEDAVFVPSEGNWPDFRQAHEGTPAFMSAWCHGAPGIGLARISGQALLDSPRVRRDIEAAVSSVRQQGLADKDGLCCGQTGRIELLLAAARVSGDRGLEELALRQASSVVRGARASGYRFSGVARGGFFDPSFFQGLSGIGYQLLRLAFPGRLPSVLVWE